MKCSICLNELKTSVRCPYCFYLFCSLSCLDSHYALNHYLNLFHKNESQNNLYFQHSTQINSIFLLKGILNTKIIYNEIYNLNNFTPIYQRDGKLKIIGSGSYGQVYLGQNVIDKKYYAIKHMDKKNILSMLDSLLNIQKEIDIQSKIDHPNIVKLLYVKETESSYDLVMEYAKEGNLFHYIRINHGLSEDESFTIFIQVVNAITFLHENDLIHRDIKPENILLFGNNIVKLCDFGWCVKLNGYQRGTFCGTTEYMSPELVNHQGYGKEIDTWSLGVLLYEMIHGYSPFKPNKLEFEPEDVMENIVNHNLKFKKQVSERCQKLIYGLLDSNIYNRYRVEDIFNSDFVKYYENIEKNGLNNNNFDYNFMEQKQPKSQINNILYSPQIEMNNKINIHMSMDYNNYIYNIQIPEKNNSFDFVKNNPYKEKINVQPVNKGIYESYISSKKNSSNNSYNSSFDDINNYNSNNNVNEILYKSSISKIINNNISEETQNENKTKILGFHKSDNNFFEKHFMKQKESKFKDLFSSYNNDANKNKNFGIPLYKKNPEKENINSNNSNYFFEAKNYINKKSYNNKNNKNDEDENILKISYLSNSQINDGTQNISEESFSKNSIKKILDNYSNNNQYQLNNHYSRDNHVKVKLIKKSSLNNKSNKLNSNLSLLSLQTPKKIFSDINNQNMDSILFINNSSIITTNKSCIDIKSQDYVSDNRIQDESRFFIDSFKKNYKYISKSEISNLTQIEKPKEKEPIDNIQKKNRPQKREMKIKEINKSLNVKNNISKTIIKRFQKMEKNKESSKSNINIFKNIHLNQPKDVLYKENIKTKNDYNLIKEDSPTEKDEIFRIMNNKPHNKDSKTIHHLTMRNNDKNPKDRKNMKKFIYKPKNDIEGKSQIYYKTEPKNNINNTTESSNLYLPANSNILYDPVETKISETNDLIKENNIYASYIIDNKNNIKKNVFQKLRKKNIIKNEEEKRPTNTKKNISILKDQYNKSIDKISNNNKKLVNHGNNSLANSHSDNNIVKLTKINKSSNMKIKDIKFKEGSTKFSNVKKVNYLNKNDKEKDKLNIIKNGIKKIYVYNNQIKNMHEKENNKIVNINVNQLKKVGKENLGDRSFDNRNINTKIINYKKYIVPIKQNEYNITNNSSNKNNVNEERNKTPEKKSIFNPVKPNILIESFKKELENKTNMIKIRYNIV